MATIEERLLALEDRQAIYQVVCGYGYSVDGCNAESVGDRYVEDGVYAVGDMPSWVGRDAIAAITRDAGHLKLVGAGCAHMSSLPFVVIEGDRAVATCHTMVPMHGESGFFSAGSAPRGSNCCGRPMAHGGSSTARTTCSMASLKAPHCWGVSTKDRTAAEIHHGHSARRHHAGLVSDASGRDRNATPA